MKGFSFGKRGGGEAKSGGVAKPTGKTASQKTGAGKAKRTGGAGVFLFVFLLIVFGGGAGYQYFYTTAAVNGLRLEITRSQQRTYDYVRKQKELEFYVQQAQNIEVNHQVIKKGGNGPAKKSELVALADIGFSLEVQPSIKVAKTFQSGWKFEGKKAEWQRIARAISTLEGTYPLLQIKGLSLALPEGVLPLTDSPTSLKAGGEFYSPKL